MRLLLAHSDRDLLVSFKELLACEGFDVVCAFDGTQVISIRRDGGFDAAVTAQRLPRVPHTQILRALREAGIPTVVLTETKLTRKTLTAPEIANDYLSFPFDSGELAALIRNVVEKKRGADIIPCGETQIDVSGFVMGDGILLTATEIDLYKSLAAGEVLRVEQLGVYADSLGDKLEASGSKLRIRYIGDEGYKLVKCDE